MMLMKRSREDNGDVEAEAMANCLMLLANAGRMTSSSSSSASKDLCSFQCKTCDKTFPSFQALGGHRASHKRAKLVAPAAGEQDSLLTGDKSNKMHRCSICGLEFSIGQALGGHMRRHRATMTKESLENPSPPPAVAVAAAVPVLKRIRSSKRVFGFDLDLDLNLAPRAEYNNWKCIGSTTTPLTPATPVLRCFI